MSEPPPPLPCGSVPAGGGGEARGGGGMSAGRRLQRRCVQLPAMRLHTPGTRHQAQPAAAHQGPNRAGRAELRAAAAQLRQPPPLVADAQRAGAVHQARGDDGGQVALDAPRLQGRLDVALLAVTGAPHRRAARPAPACRGEGWRLFYLCSTQARDGRPPRILLRLSVATLPRQGAALHCTGGSLPLSHRRFGRRRGAGRRPGTA